MGDFLDLMSNYGKALEYSNAATNSSGAAIDKMGTYEDSIEAKTKLLTASFQELSADTINGGLVKGFLDFANVLVKVTDKVGVFNVALVSLAGILGVKSALGGNAFAGVLKGLTTNMGITTAVAGTLTNALSVALPVAGVLLAYKGFDYLNKSIDRTIEKSDKLQQSIADDTSVLQKNNEWIQTNASRYEELSKGVDALGRNISLTKAEFQEYNNLANQIADMFPAFVTGYTDTGTAILSVKGNIEALTQAYKAQEQAAKDAVIVGSSEIFNGFIAKTSRTSSGFLNVSSLENRSKLSKNVIDNINNRQELGNLLFADRGLDSLDLNKMLKDSGIGEQGFFETNDNYIKRIQDNLNKLSAYYRTTISDLNTETQKLVPVIDAFLGNNDDFNSLGSDIQDSIKQVVDNLGYNFYSQFNSDSELQDWLDNLSGKIKNDSELQNAFSELFSLDKSKMPTSEYNKQVDDSISIISESLNVDPVKLKIQLGIENADDLIKQIQKKFGNNSDLQKYINTLTPNELKVFYSLEPIPGGSVEDYKLAMEKAISISSVASNALYSTSDNVEEANKKIDSYQSSMKTIRSAFDSISSLSSSDITDLMQEFASFDWKKYDVTGAAGVGDLTGALKALAAEQYNNITVTNGQKEAFESLYEETVHIGTSVESLSSVMSSISDVNDIIGSVKNDIKDMGSISEETLNSIATKYPELETLVAEYNAGIASTGDIISALSVIYDQDENNFRLTNNAKLVQSEIFYQQVYNKIPDYLKNLAKTYDIDLKYFKNVALAKAAINNKLVTELNKAWTDGNGDKLKDADQQRLEQTILKQPKTVDLFTLSDSITSITADLQTDFTPKLPEQKTNNSTNKNEKNEKGKQNQKDKPENTFSQQIDWTTQVLNNLQNSVNDAQKTLENTNGYAAQITAIKALISEQESLRDGYESAVKKYTTQYNSITGIDSYKKKIESGKIIKASDFKDEALYNKVKSAQDSWNSYQEYLDKVDEIKNTIDENTDKKFEINVDLTLEPFEKNAEKLNNTLDEISKTASFVDDGSTAQILLYQTSYNKASEAASNLNKEIAALNKTYANNTDSENYKKRLSELNSKLGDTTSAMKSYQKDILNAVKQRYDKELESSKAALDNELKNIEKKRKAEIEAINIQIRNYKEYIDERKKSLQDQYNANEYQKQLDEYSKSITKLENRIHLIKKAELTGDRSATAERVQLEEELTKQKQELTDTQNKHNLDMSLDALDDENDVYEKMQNNQINDINSKYDVETDTAQKLYDFKTQHINKIYEDEKQLIVEAARLTSEEFSAAFADINSTLSSYGLTISSDLSKSLKTTNKDNKKTVANSPVLNKSEIDNLLNNGEGKTSKSALNKYVNEKYSSSLSFSQMVKLASLLGVTGINQIEDVSSNSDNRVKILKALKAAKFTTGGTVDASKNNKLASLLGEDGIAFVKHKEEILTPEKANLLRSLIDVALPLKNIGQIATNNISNLTTNNSSSPNIIFNLNGGTVTKEVMPQFDRWKDDISRMVIKTMECQIRRK